MDKKILNNYNKLKKNIKEVCKKINRNPNDINLVSVSKASSISEIEILINNEHRCFGENRLNNATIFKILGIQSFKIFCI